MLFAISYRKLFASIGTLFSANILSRLISSVTLIMTARFLGPEGFGPLAASFSLARLTSVFFSLGLNSWILRSASKEADQLGVKTGSIVIIKFIGGLLWMAALTAASTFLNQESFPTLIVLLCAAAVWLEEITLTPSITFQATLRNRLTAVILVGSQALILIATLIVVLTGRNTAEAYLYSRFIASVIGAVIAFALLARFITLGFQRHNLGRALRETLSFAVSLGLSQLSRQADVTIVGNWLGKAAAGLYAPAINLSSTVFLIPTSVYGVMLPVLSQQYDHSPGRLRRSISPFIVGMTALGALLAVLMAITSPWIVRLLYGPDYALSGDILQIFSLILLLRCTSTATGAILTAVDWQRQRVYVLIVSVAFNLLFNLYIVTFTDWSLLGIAAVYVITEVIQTLGYGYYTWRWARAIAPLPAPSQVSQS